MYRAATSPALSCLLSIRVKSGHSFAYNKLNQWRMKVKAGTARQGEGEGGESERRREKAAAAAATREGAEQIFDGKCVCVCLLRLWSVRVRKDNT